ncbi:MAG: ABC transporter substrate-binding protein [Bdellovibrionales bacterium]|nr:ABC transporter substrate-binding protein [Bdellovibrionales bacterium]
MGLCSLVVGGLVMFGGMSEKPRSIKVGYGQPWKSIHPGLQHTAVADFVLSNQFEALVGYDQNNNIVPLGAKSWRVNDDMTVYTFKIDTDRKFSDGSSLTSHDYKRSWEEALSLDPKSANSSLADVLHMLEGADRFHNLGYISGIETPDSSTLILRFKETYRTALDYLHGNRLAAYKKVGDRYIGTGAYSLRELGTDNLVAQKNPYSNLSSKGSELEMIVIDPTTLKKSIESGIIDIYAFEAGSRVAQENLTGPNTKVLVGQDAINEALYLNSLPGRLFSDKRLRKALLYLIHQAPSGANKLVRNPKYFSSDPQALLPLQAGRLSDQEANKLVQDGERYVPILIEESKKKPLIVYVGKGETWVLDHLENFGLVIDRNLSKEADPSERISNYYKEHRSDILLAGYSISGADPDSVYHVMGKHGAITSPMIQSRVIAEILEDGRQIVDSNRVNTQYEKFSRAFLEEVPLVHLGFSKAITVYNSKRVGIDSAVIRRNNGHLYPFYSKSP